MISIAPASLKKTVLRGDEYASGFTAREAKLGELAWYAQAYVWSPIIWRDGRRLQDHFASSIYLALDFDDEMHAFPIVQARRSFADLAHWIGTTRNHRREKNGVVCDRYRVVVPFSAPITDIETYRYNVGRAFKTFPHADASCIDGARFFFPCRAVVELIIDGDPWDVERPPKEKLQTTVFSAHRPGAISRRAREYLEQEFKPGDRHKTMYMLGAELCRCRISIDETLALAANCRTIRELPNRAQELMLAVRDGWKREKDDREKLQKKETAPAGTDAAL